MDAIKRMSVILGYPYNSAKLLVKGADTYMLSVINKSSNMQLKAIHNYSSLGLRTLVIGIRELNANDTATSFS